VTAVLSIIHRLHMTAWTSNFLYCVTAAGSVTKMQSTSIHHHTTSSLRKTHEGVLKLLVAKRDATGRALHESSDDSSDCGALLVSQKGCLCFYVFYTHLPPVDAAELLKEAHCSLL